MTGKPVKTSPSTQDPHQVGPDRERNLEVAIGREIRAHRQNRNLTVKELSDSTGLSVGMLSKIENGMTSPSLTTLETLSAALSIPLASLFRRYDEAREVVHTKADEGVETVREGTRAGHQYKLLGHLNSSAAGVVVEPYMITLTDQSDRFQTFQHEGLETIYMLEGRVTYRHGNEHFELVPGDTLFFDADAPHGPEELSELPIKFLSIIAYPS